MGVELEIYVHVQWKGDEVEWIIQFSWLNLDLRVFMGRSPIDVRKKIIENILG